MDSRFLVSRLSSFGSGKASTSLDDSGVLGGEKFVDISRASRKRRQQRQSRSRSGVGKRQQLRDASIERGNDHDSCVFVLGFDFCWIGWPSDFHVLRFRMDSGSLSFSGRHCYSCGWLRWGLALLVVVVVVVAASMIVLGPLHYRDKKEVIGLEQISPAAHSTWMSVVAENWTKSASRVKNWSSLALPALRDNVHDHAYHSRWLDYTWFEGAVGCCFGWKAPFSDTE